MLVHGTRFSARSWDGYAELVPGAEVRAVDLPGHGSRAGQAYTSASAVAVVEQEVGTAGPRRPAVLAGHSLGGYVSAAYAARHPDRLSGLVLIGAAADPSRHPHLARAYTGFARLVPVVGPERMSRFANGVLRCAGLPAEKMPGAAGYAVTQQAWGSVVAESRASQLAGVSCPVYLVGGQFDQLRIDTAAYARACREPHVHVIRGATHLAPLTHPEAVAAILRQAVAAARAS